MSAAAVAPISPSGSSRARVMVVDDSAVVRGLVSRWINESGQFEVVGTAPNGRVAIDMMDWAQPDIVLLDLDMPELDGIGTLPHLLRKRPQMSVIVVSTLTQRNADVSLSAIHSRSPAADRPEGCAIHTSGSLPSRRASV